ncbi:MAG: hypothetical protein JO089_09205 [Alphaproteobacteria bacterium]|nr:hypothetical protein [Alphaproteobacteria bacterium]
MTPQTPTEEEAPPPEAEDEHNLPPDYAAVAQRVKSGEYFHEARSVYASLYLNPITERYLFLAVTALALMILTVCGMAVSGLFPLRTPVPFVYYDEHYMDEYPTLSSLAQPGEAPNMTIKRFLVGQYITRRESYDINQLELNVRFVKQQSTPEVFVTWQKQLDPANPESPITRFERHATRSIEITSLRPRGTGAMEADFDAVVHDGPTVKKTHMHANIAFRFQEITVDQKTGKATPLQFVVTDYSTSTMQD